MVRDWDLIRKIPVATEEKQPGQTVGARSIDGYSPAIVGGHIALLKDGGFITATISPGGWWCRPSSPTRESRLRVFAAAIEILKRASPLPLVEIPPPAFYADQRKRRFSLIQISWRFRL
jgi:hypothetical protein